MPVRLLSILLVLLVAAACDTSADTLTSAPPVSEPASATATASPAPDLPVATTTPAMTATPDPIDGAPSGERALAHARVLAADIGERTAGSAEERRAAAYITEQLLSFGYAVELQPFPISTFVSRSVTVRVLSPNEETLRATPFTGTSAGTATGDLYVAGAGLSTDYPAGGIGGRVALVRRGQVTFGDMARNAYAAGASAVLVYDPNGDLISGRLTGQTPPIPALSIPGSDGQRLASAGGSGPVRVTLSFDGGMEQVTAHNVIGRPPGGQCLTVAGGHYDTVAGAPGASDNASGTATMLELARVQAARGNPEQTCFIAFSGEELGLLGSQYYVENLTDEQRRAIRFMLNLDMTAVGDQWWLVGSRTLQTRGRDIAAQAGVTMTPRELIGASSDHAAFIDRRIPAIMIHRADDRLLHTPEDVIDRITAPPLETAVQMGLAFLIAFSAG